MLHSYLSTNKEQTKMTNDEVAKVFSQGAIKGNSLHMFIDGDTIYSYGYHFPIAKRIEDSIGTKFLFTSNGYSVTTARHKNMVKSWLEHTGKEIVMADLKDTR